jgi:CRISPR/Cas system-associated endoribonuclease Cas2
MRDIFMKRTVLLGALFGMTLAFTVLFNGCDTTVNGKNTAPGGLEGEWEGVSELGAPVLMMIKGGTITMESLGVKIKGTYTVEDGTIIYRSTHIYDTDKQQYVDTAAYNEKLKKEYLDVLQESLKTGELTQEEYEAEAANAENLFAMPETEIIPYRLEGGNNLILTLEHVGDVVLTRR